MDSYDDNANFIAACVREALSSGCREWPDIRRYIDDRIAALSETERGSIAVMLVAMASSDDRPVADRKLH